MASTTSAAVRRVLVLHGYSQNAIIFSKRLGALRKESKDIEYVFLNAPHILLPAELFGSPTRFDSVTQGEVPSEADTQVDPDLALRAWWRKNKEGTEARGLAESIMYIREVLREGRYDGIFGFSQGAAFAAVISALLERPHLHPPFLVDGKPPHPPLKFCVAVSGFKLLDPLCNPFFTPNYTTPTLHVLGRTDVVVVEERSRTLCEVSKNARLEEHDGGHFVPSKGNWRKFLVNYMKDPLGPHMSPTATSGANAGVTETNGHGNYKSALMMKL